MLRTRRNPHALSPYRAWLGRPDPFWRPTSPTSSWETRYDHSLAGYIAGPGSPTVIRISIWGLPLTYGVCALPIAMKCGVLPCDTIAPCRVPPHRGKREWPEKTSKFRKRGLQTVEPPQSPPPTTPPVTPCGGGGGASAKVAPASDYGHPRETHNYR